MIHPIYDQMVSRGEREKKLRQRAKVVWLFGLSGSGKSTLATALEHRLFADGFVTAHLDGDNLRDGLNKGLGFTDGDREENIRRVAEVSKLFFNSGLVCLNSFITPKESLRELARTIIGPENLLEIFVEASFETCRQRDVKGSIAERRRGRFPTLRERNRSSSRPRGHTLL